MASRPDSSITARRAPDKTHLLSSSSPKMHPAAHTSTAAVYCRAPKNSSGARYHCANTCLGGLGGISRAHGGSQRCGTWAGLKRKDRVQRQRVTARGCWTPALVQYRLMAGASGPRAILVSFRMTNSLNCPDPRATPPTTRAPPRPPSRPFISTQVLVLHYCSYAARQRSTPSPVCNTGTIRTSPLPRTTHAHLYVRWPPGDLWSPHSRGPSLANPTPATITNITTSSTTHLVCQAAVRRAVHPAEPEVRQLERPVGSYEAVVGLDVAVEHPPAGRAGREFEGGSARPSQRQPR